MWGGAQALGRARKPAAEWVSTLRKHLVGSVGKTVVGIRENGKCYGGRESAFWDLMAPWITGPQAGNPGGTCGTYIGTKWNSGGLELLGLCRTGGGLNLAHSAGRAVRRA